VGEPENNFAVIAIINYWPKDPSKTVRQLVLAVVCLFCPVYFFPLHRTPPGHPDPNINSLTVIRCIFFGNDFGVNISFLPSCPLRGWGKGTVSPATRKGRRQPPPPPWEARRPPPLAVRNLAPAIDILGVRPMGARGPQADPFRVSRPSVDRLFSPHREHVQSFRLSIAWPSKNGLSICRVRF